jgi:hypothetical protein
MAAWQLTLLQRAGLSALTALPLSPHSQLTEQLTPDSSARAMGDLYGNYLWLYLTEHYSG